jgi:hypothetical protein
VIGESNLEEEEELYTTSEESGTDASNGCVSRKRKLQSVVTLKNYSTPKEGYHPRLETSEMEDSFDCKICSDLFSSPSDLKSHYDEKHQSDIVISNQCCYCLKTFKQ